MMAALMAATAANPGFGSKAALPDMRMRRIAIADGDAFGKIEGLVEASLACSGAFNG
jgi:hypothetical protein